MRLILEDTSQTTEGWLDAEERWQSDGKMMAMINRFMVHVQYVLQYSLFSSFEMKTYLNHAWCSPQQAQSEMRGNAADL